jgi:hypothetical protein
VLVQAGAFGTVSESNETKNTRPLVLSVTAAATERRRSNGG